MSKLFEIIPFKTVLIGYCRYPPEGSKVVSTIIIVLNENFHKAKKCYVYHCTVGIQITDIRITETFEYQTL